MSKVRPACPRCGSSHTVKNGRIHNKKPKYQCQDCKRQFLENPSKKYISQETKDWIERLLLEKIPLAGIARAAEVSEVWLQEYVNSLYVQVSRLLKVSPKRPGKLRIQCDELWSFVGKKSHQQWIWLALDEETREIVGYYVGARSETGARGLWNSLPAVYRQYAKCFTDFWAAYAQVIPSKQHQSVSKESGKTSYIERFNNTLRQRVSRLVRKTLSFSKKLDNHIGAILYFLHHYNECLQV